MPDLPATRIEPLGRFSDAQPENPRREPKEKLRARTAAVGLAGSAAAEAPSVEVGAAEEKHELDEMA